MADVISAAIPGIELLLSLITPEASLILELKDDYRAIRDELNSIKVRLQNKEEIADGGDWVRQVRTLSHEIEDVIDEYCLSQKRNGFIDKMKQYVPIHLRSIAIAIKSIRKRSDEIHKRKEKYSSSVNQRPEHNSFEGSTHQATILSLGMTNESELVGVKTAKKDLIGKLGLQDFEDSKISTIAVIGMRGLGKTTVVSSVYNDESVREYFPIRAWIHVSGSYNNVHLLRSMLNQFYDAAIELEQFGRVTHYDSTTYPTLQEINLMEERSLICKLRKFLAEKRYLVVFDDVHDGELATYVKKVLQFNDNKASKIVMTTRYDNVACKWVGVSEHGKYKLKPLPFEEALELFRKRAFINIEGNNRAEYDRLAPEIVKRCEGLPFIISEMGRLLSPGDLDEWEKMSESLRFYLQQDHKGIYQLLIHSYTDLPHYLKPCFLYFGLFPERYPIPQGRIIRLWIAEGFAMVGGNGGSSNQTSEELAENFIKELVHMNLIEEKTDATGKCKNLQVSELMREMILSKVEELTLSGNKISGVGEEPVKPRRLSIHKGCSHQDADRQVMHSITEKRSSIRTLLYADMNLSPKVSKTLFSKNFRLLKVLDICNASIDDLPKEVGKLLNLRYLSVRNTRVSRLPSSIGELQYLQTLDLKQSPIYELPDDLNKLHKLRHLLTYRNENHPEYSLHTQRLTGVKLPEKALEKFGELQKLAFVDVGHRSAVVKELRNLRQLRRLGITELKSVDGEDLCDAIQEMKSLETFSVYSSEKETIDLVHFKSSQMKLKRLYLNGPLKTPFSGWILKLHSLVKIRLRWSSLEDDPLQILETLPNLVELHMLEAYNGDNLNFGNGGFKRLKMLHLLDLRNLKSLSICEGALPLLQLMAIGKSTELQVPQDIKHLSRLETLNFFNMPLDFAHSLQRNGQYHSIVKHVPNVLFQKWVSKKGEWETCFL